MKSDEKSSNGPRKLVAPPEAQIAAATSGAVAAVTTARGAGDIVARLR